MSFTGSTRPAGVRLCDDLPRSYEFRRAAGARFKPPTEHSHRASMVRMPRACSRLRISARFAAASARLIPFMASLPAI